MAKYRVQNPKTNEIEKTYENITSDELEQALSTADETFKQWREKSYEERAEVLRKVAKLFDDKRDELARIIANEMGKAVDQGDGEVDDVVEIFNYYADNGAKFGADEEIPNERGGTSIMRKIPLGVIVGVMPWNFPYYQVARFAAPALMAGNVVMVKHANICPESAEAIEKIFDEAGAPKGLYTNIFAGHSQISKLINDDRVQGVSLTGSEGAGRSIASQAGQALKKCVLELGGTDAYIVLDSTDIPAAAKTAWDKRIGNTGQACTSNKRMIVMEDIYDEFVDELVKIASSYTEGDPLNPEEGKFYPMSSRDAAENLVQQLKIAVEEGAKIHVGGEVTGKGAYFTPAVITDIPVGSDSYYEEFFGPVAEVYKVSSEEEAIEVANDSRYGLGGAVMSEDAERAKRVADKVDTGMIHVNIPQARGAELPFGGVKASGLGRELGPLGMDEFVNKQRFYIAGSDSAV
ncbi:NAD-dependent succinate-semialdehyde dehydrogenase [Corynebacterium lujinxingii]|uniref:NAD-dependent succinate-semialdehyde dehydrogenase n=1 Tax=Corynebacterium lujinxingii TaxID=2763010 RepID=A0A7H0JXD6_9CORY|nr:NAD-dependent succinate-semialdehyde dehydrogenase [Corynebacterium lujinxingii]MBC3177864.1 NAD-dependent succinate-semialdehyde dehydrogenase [Corynebacterium lujinxingii]NNO09891.1 aldehyde dehydrogenase family protein [Corynebacterium lujinxingii]QNP89702.1 NAD-dependent succinate-semialdehyde dehydrogenase [Corynebacterium lujinxingii]